MLREFYKLGMLYALEKNAAVGELIRASLRGGTGAIAKSVARRQAVGGAKGEMRQMLGLETPEWRRGGVIELLPSLVATRAQEDTLNAMGPKPEASPFSSLTMETAPKPERPRTKEVQLRLPKPKIPKPKKK